jgi:acetyl-CoA carboxylase biotin carboxyl carrier protein
MEGKKRQSAAGSEQQWHLEDIQKLIDSLVERDISEFEMEQNGLRIRIRRGEAPVVASASMTTSAVAPVALPAVVLQPGVMPSATVPAAPTASPGGATPTEAVSVEPAEELHTIKSPIVGTFYRSATPKSEPFVNPGDAVRVGQVLCIIEAMKLMNEIESEVSGEVVRICVENGQPVEYGQSLFAIRPSPKE